MIISRTPFRISFFGGGTDFPGYFRERGGSVLSASIDRYCYLSVHPLAPLFEHRFRASYSQTESVKCAEEFRHPLIRETLREMGVEEGLEISHVSDLPGQTGLGTSSAFTVGLLNALKAFRGESAGAEWLARTAIRVERERVGDAGGWQDQYAVAYGGLNRIDFGRDGRVAVRKARVDGAAKRALEERLMLFYLGTAKTAGEVLRRQEARTAANAADLDAMKQMADEAESALERGRTDDFGRLLEETWKRKRRLADGISTGDIDAAHDAALRAGALGGKLLGAGGRGFLCLYVPPEAQEGVRAALEGLREVRVGFEEGGSKIIYDGGR